MVGMKGCLCEIKKEKLQNESYIPLLPLTGLGIFPERSLMNLRIEMGTA